ncbi:hypothetical protein [Gracilibacillus sp. JCM 18860]|uniref:hypothetical protein n=1 Tax=Gracilibacillus sp. JCM 18860 TaxID=1306159 RepID=UPI0006CF7DD3
MRKEVFEVDGQGFIIENYPYSEKEIQNAIDNGKSIITKGWQDLRLFKPKWDFETEQWIEGLTSEEIAEREALIAEQQSVLPDQDLNAIALMELASTVYEGGVSECWPCYLLLISSKAYGLMRKYQPNYNLMSKLS